MSAGRPFGVNGMIEVMLFDSQMIGFIVTYIVILIQFDSKAREINGINNLVQMNSNQTTSLAPFANQTVY